MISFFSNSNPIVQKLIDSEQFFYLTGSRALFPDKPHHDDWDFFATYSDQMIDLLKSLNFSPVKEAAYSLDPFLSHIFRNIDYRVDVQLYPEGRIWRKKNAQSLLTNPQINARIWHLQKDKQAMSVIWFLAMNVGV